MLTCIFLFFFFAKEKNRMLTCILVVLFAGKKHMSSILLYCRLPIKEKTKVLTCFFYLYSFTGVKHLLVTNRHLICPKYESSAYSNVYCLLNKRIWKLCPNFVLILLLNLRISIGHNIHSPRTSACYQSTFNLFQIWSSACNNVYSLWLSNTGICKNSVIILPLIYGFQLASKFTDFNWPQYPLTFKLLIQLEDLPQSFVSYSKHVCTITQIQTSSDTRRTLLIPSGMTWSVSFMMALTTSLFPSLQASIMGVYWGYRMYTCYVIQIDIHSVEVNKNYPSALWSILYI